MRVISVVFVFLAGAVGCAHSSGAGSASSSVGSPAVADAFRAVRSGDKATAVAGNYRFCATPRGLAVVTTTGSSQLNSKIRDAAIQSTVKSAIDHDPALAGSDIEVKTDKGEVRLTGHVDSDAAALLATKRALSAEGTVFANVALTSPESPEPPARMSNPYPSCML